MKLSEKFLADLTKEWKRSGPEALERAAATDPTKFVSIVANLMPKQLEHLLCQN
jgi:hypothetical protein